MIKEYLTLKEKHTLFISIDIGPNSRSSPSLDYKGKSQKVEIQSFISNNVYIRTLMVGNPKSQRLSTLFYHLNGVNLGH